MNKLILLGLDGATWSQFNKFLKNNSMPSLSKIISNGIHAELNSTFPFTSRTSWISMMTGTNPGKHGIPHHIVGGKQELPSIWNILSTNQKKVIIVNDIVTYPPVPVNGIMITGGFSTPPNSKEFVFPKSLIKEINYITDGYIPSLPSSFMKKLEVDDFDGAFEQLQTYGKKIITTSLHLAEKNEWDYLQTILENTDYLHHFFWDKPEYLEKFYIWLDEILGKYVNLAEKNNANLLITSDHGFGPINKHFLINSWLQQTNLTNFGKTNKVRRFLANSNINKRLIKKSLAKFNLTKTISKLTPSELKKIIPVEKNEEGFIQKESKVYSEAYNEITINVDDKNEYESLCKEIIDLLKNLKDGEKKIIKEVYKKTEIFHGPFVNRAFDIQFLLNEGYCWSSSIKKEYLLERDELSKIRSGDHRPEGVFLAMGPDIKNHQELLHAKIWDIFPTILHMLSQQIPSYVDGKILKEIFNENSAIFKQESIIKKSEKQRLKEKIFSNRDKLKI